MSDSQDQEFPQFSQLPAELRLAVWLLCLPCRVVEIDKFQEARFPIPDCEFTAPCKWHHTTKVNQCRLPRISQVCHESRQVALKAGRISDKSDVPVDAKWDSTLLKENLRVDPIPDSLHLHWDPSLTPFCSSGGPFKGSALEHLTYRASQAQGGSFMFYYIEGDLDNYDKRIKMKDKLGALQALQNAAVVMRTVVIHMTIKNARSTGLFGLLGDAPIQIVNVFDTERQAAYYDLAKKGEGGTFIIAAQDLERKSPFLDQATLKKRLSDIYGPEGANTLSLLYPAIMFRLCTQFCEQPLERMDDRKARGLQ
ncbi:hypothetical protein N7456_007796 [Penicillium angulare]|uniref:2EXR domain-containing protein n=1 Tax=Penicillium angulare TaxID=116970 RepID=A0A9W9FBJ9_9EURO|nr:hypothetical protein N7456_007796 [Penicillium angulare]